PRKLPNFRELHWLSINVGWPPEGALHLPLSKQSQTLPLWVRFCTNRQGQSRIFGKNPIFQGDPVEDPLLPPPYVTLTPQALAQPAPDSLRDSPPHPPPPCPLHHLMSKTPAPTHQMPLQETQGPQQVNKDSSPFRTTDLLNWKQEGQETLSRYHDALLHGLRAGAKKPSHMSKVRTIIQKAGETLSDFYERLCEVFRTYTPFDPGTADNQWMINTAFVAQSGADIQQKLQKLEGFTGMNATQLLEVANKVFMN
ncbi:hypothetical protein FD755_019682, partial [Muntiacus reevesi]